MKPSAFLLTVTVLLSAIAPAAAEPFLATGDVRVKTDSANNVVLVLDKVPLSGYVEEYFKFIPPNPVATAFDHVVRGATIDFRDDRLIVSKQSATPPFYFDVATYQNTDPPPAWATGDAIVIRMGSGKLLGRGWEIQGIYPLLDYDVNFVPFKTVLWCDDAGCQSGGQASRSCSVGPCKASPDKSPNCSVGCGLASGACCYCGTTIEDGPNGPVIKDLAVCDCCFFFN